MTAKKDTLKYSMALYMVMSLLKTSSAQRNLKADSSNFTDQRKDFDAWKDMILDNLIIN